MGDELRQTLAGRSYHAHHLGFNTCIMCCDCDLVFLYCRRCGRPELEVVNDGPVALCRKEFANGGQYVVSIAPADPRAAGGGDVLRPETVSRSASARS